MAYRYVEPHAHCNGSYGMATELGPVSLEESRASFLGGVPQAPWQERQYSEQTAREVDCAVRAIVESAFGHAVRALERNRNPLERSARLLLEKETLTESELAQFHPVPVEQASRSAPAPTPQPS